MIYQIAVLSAVLAATASATLYRDDASQQKFMWESFKREYNKNYSSMDEENHRFNTFLNNLKVADERNAAERAAGGSAVHGITHFSDLSQAEFESRYLLSDPKMKLGEAKLDATERTVDTLASLVDWTGKLTTPVKNQGYCGSCWAFSATEQIESDAMRTLGKSWTLSPEQIVQCDTTSYGCNGGWTEHAYKYVKGAGGLATEASYPYSSYYGTTGSCHSSSSQYVVTVTGYTTISGESNMAAWVQQHGPLSVCVDASTWNSYNGGIMKSCGKQVDHCVQAVGVDATSSGYWKVRNSWGTSWGESGFIRLAYGANTCAITNDPTYVSVAAK
jgi:C1A family cysteine protease